MIDNRKVLYGPNGKPIAGALYPSPRWNPKQYKPRFILSRTTKENVTPYDRSELVNYSRQLRAQVPVLATAIEQKNSWAFGDAWDPHYQGRNEAWGRAAEDWLRNVFYPYCNVRGKYYNFKRSLRLSGEAWDVDGDDLMVLTESQNGFPMIMFYPSTRIGSGQDGMGRKQDQVSGGPFDGATIHDGIITDRLGRMIGVRIINEDETWLDISAANCDLAYEPSWHDQGRGIPRIAVSLLRWMNVQDIDDFLQRGIKRAASIGLKFKVAGGEAALGNEIVIGEESSAVDTSSGQVQVGGESPRKVYYEEVAGGEMYYLDSQSNEEIEALNYQNPHPNTEAFVERIERGSLASVGWYYELLNLQETGRAPTRLLADLANQSIWERQATGMIRAQRIIAYAIAKAMKHGYLPRNDDGPDPYMWEFGLPKPLSVDAGNDEAADRENLKMGTTSKTIIAQKKGWHRLEILAHRKREIVEQAMAAAEIESQTQGKITFDRALELLEQRAANPTAQQPAQDDGNDDDE